MRRFNTWGLLALTGAAAAANAAEQICVEEVIVTATRRALDVRDVPAWVVAGAVSLAAAWLLPGQWHIVLGAIAGSLTGAAGAARVARAASDAA